MTPKQFKQKVKQVFPSLDDAYINGPTFPDLYYLTFDNQGISGKELNALMRIARVVRVWATEDTYGTTQFTVTPKETQ